MIIWGVVACGVFVGLLSAPCLSQSSTHQSSTHQSSTQSSTIADQGYKNNTLSRCQVLRFQIDTNIRFCGTASPVFTSSQSRELQKLFPGVFHSYYSYRRMIWGKKGFNKIQYSRPSSNGDMCCPTRLVVGQRPPKLRNMYGRMRSMVHLPSIGHYQWITYGKCMQRRCRSGGRCVQEHSIQFLLVWNRANRKMPFAFEAFNIPAYCSCKNIYRGNQNNGNRVLQGRL